MEPRDASGSPRAKAGDERTAVEWYMRGTCCAASVVHVSDVGSNISAGRLPVVEGVSAARPLIRAAVIVLGLLGLAALVLLFVRRRRDT